MIMPERERGLCPGRVACLLLLAFALSACGQWQTVNPSEDQAPIGSGGVEALATFAKEPIPAMAEEADPMGKSATADEGDQLTIRISIGGKALTAIFVDSEPARAIFDQLPFELEMREYGGQEKVARLPFKIPSASAEKPLTIYEGDIYLWSGDQLVLFYTTFQNVYDGYIRIGHFEDASGLADTLGRGDVTVRFENASDITSEEAE